MKALRRWLGSGEPSPEARRPSLCQMPDLHLKGAIRPDPSKSRKGDFTSLTQWKVCESPTGFDSAFEVRRPEVKR